jgi:hypothetical protein
MEYDPRNVIITTNSSIIRMHRPGAWSVLSVNAVNRTDEWNEGLISVYFPPDVGRQFVRRVLVPPQSARQTWLPIRFPTGIPQQVERHRYTSLALDPKSPREVLQRKAGEPMMTEHLVGVSHGPVKTATVLRQPNPFGKLEEFQVDRDSWDTMMAARVAIGLDESANDMHGDFLPPWSQVLQGFDQFMVTSDRIVRDSAGLNSLRGWLREGGRLWLSLDTLSIDTARIILGDAARLEIVDQVELDQYTIQTAGGSDEPLSEDQCDLETPVPMVRVITTATNVPCRVNGWPAAIWVPFGEGEVLITTLGARGWRPEFEKGHTKALRYLASRFFVSRDERFDPKGFQAAVQQQIGYSIPSRWLPLTALGGFWFVLLGGIFVLWRRTRLENLTWFVPLAALLSAGALVFVGQRSSHQVPPTIASFELVRVTPETDEFLVDGLAAIYDQQTRPVQWKATERYLMYPETQADAEVRREVWTDNDSVETQNATSRAGSIGVASFVGSRTARSPVSLRGSFTAAGLQGQLIMSDESASDSADANLASQQQRNLVLDPLVVSLPNLSAAVKFTTDGQFTVSPADVLATGQYSTETLLSDEQRWRSEALKQLFTATDGFVFPRRSSLVFWSDADEPTLQLPDGFERRNRAVHVIPFEFGRTPSDTSFVVPASFLSVSSVDGRQGRSTAFNARTGEWVKGLNTPTETVLRFQVPAEVLPCQLERATLAIRLNVPTRNLIVSTVLDAEYQVVHTEKDPSGLLQIELTGEQLRLDRQGGVRIALEITKTHPELEALAAKKKPVLGESSAATSSGNSTWQIDYLRLSVAGKTDP